MENFERINEISLDTIQKWMYTPIEENYLYDILLVKFVSLFKERDDAIEEDDKIQITLLDYEIRESIYLISFPILGFISTKNKIKDKTALNDVASVAATNMIKKFNNNEMEFKSSDYSTKTVFGYFKQFLVNSIRNYSKQKEFLPLNRKETLQRKKEAEENDEEFVVESRLVSFDKKIGSEKNATIGDTLVSEQFDPVKVQKSKQLHEELMDILDELVELEKSNKGKTIINLLFIEKLKGNQMSQKEIAKIAGCSAPFVVKKEKQVLEKLRTLEYLKEYLE